jgi:aryl-alcohol dehydrogenase-like predicted oxidoreductase
MLGGALKKAAKGRRSSAEGKRRLEQHRDQLEAFEKLCADLGEEPANVAVAWLLANPVVTAPIIGPRTMGQLDGAMRALEIRLDAATMKKLDRIFPGPGGPAPEAYAW